MVKILVVDRSGSKREVKANVGTTLMEALRDNGCGELLALCGGCCACGTCHVYIDSEFAETLGPASAEEQGMLEVSDHRTPMSRLSCQIPITAAIDGILVTIAPED